MLIQRACRLDSGEGCNPYATRGVFHFLQGPSGLWGLVRQGAKRVRWQVARNTRGSNYFVRRNLQGTGQGFAQLVAPTGANPGLEVAASVAAL